MRHEPSGRDAFPKRPHVWIARIIFKLPCVRTAWKAVPTCVVAPLIACVIFLAGCNREKITVYSVPKEEAQPMPASGVESAGAGDATWTAPQGWKQQPAAPPRLATFLVEGDNGKADVSVTAFPGDTGGDLANVNRWRGQIGLQPITEADLGGALQKFDAGALHFLVAELENGGKTILGAMLHRDDRTWFFKMTGDAPLVAAQKNAFNEFLKSVRFGSAPVAEASAPPAAPTPPAAESENKPKDKPAWKTPSGWQEQPAGGMRLGSFSVAEDDRKADVSIIVLGGGAGGTLANINRWRQQISLPPISDTDLAAQSEKVDTANGKALVVDIVAESPTIDGKYKARILGAIIEHGAETWFVKMNGEDALVEKQKPVFLDFLKSITLPAE